MVVLTPRHFIDSKHSGGQSRGYLEQWEIFKVKFKAAVCFCFVCLLLLLNCQLFWSQWCKTDCDIKQNRWEKITCGPKHVQAVILVLQWCKPFLCIKRPSYANDWLCKLADDIIEWLVVTFEAAFWGVGNSGVKATQSHVASMHFRYLHMWESLIVSFFVYKNKTINQIRAISPGSPGEANRL